MSKVRCGHWLRLCSASLPLLLIFWGDAWAASYPAKYDGDIQRAVEKWWVDVPTWRLWKAQLFAESRLSPDAVSPVGAEGIAQFMESSWKDAIRALGWPTTLSRRDAAYAIEGGAWYMRKLRAGWKPRGARTPLESHWLAAASYNRGTGNIIKDQAACHDALLWKDIEICTANKTMETVIYVRRIQEYWLAMEAR